MLTGFSKYTRSSIAAAWFIAAAAASALMPVSPASAR